jgi:hypothetical protein
MAKLKDQKYIPKCMDKGNQWNFTVQIMGDLAEM